VHHVRDRSVSRACTKNDATSQPVPLDDRMDVSKPDKVTESLQAITVRERSVSRRQNEEVSNTSRETTDDGLVHDNIEASAGDELQVGAPRGRSVSRVICNDMNENIEQNLPNAAPRPRESIMYPRRHSLAPPNQHQPLTWKNRPTYVAEFANRQIEYMGNDVLEDAIKPAKELPHLAIDKASNLPDQSGFFTPLETPPTSPNTVTDRFESRPSTARDTSKSSTSTIKRLLRKFTRAKTDVGPETDAQYNNNISSVSGSLTCRESTSTATVVDNQMKSQSARTDSSRWPNGGYVSKKSRRCLMEDESTPRPTAFRRPILPWERANCARRTAPALPRGQQETVPPIESISNPEFADHAKILRPSVRRRRPTVNAINNLQMSQLLEYLTSSSDTIRLEDLCTPKIFLQEELSVVRPILQFTGTDVNEISERIAKLPPKEQKKIFRYCKVKATIDCPHNNPFEKDSSEVGVPAPIQESEPLNSLSSEHNLVPKHISAVIPISNSPTDPLKPETDRSQSMTSDSCANSYPSKSSSVTPILNPPTDSLKPGTDRSQSMASDSCAISYPSKSSSDVYDSQTNDSCRTEEGSDERISTNRSRLEETSILIPPPNTERTDGTLPTRAEPSTDESCVPTPPPNSNRSENSGSSLPFDSFDHSHLNVGACTPSVHSQGWSDRSGTDEVSYTDMTSVPQERYNGKVPYVPIQGSIMKYSPRKGIRSGEDTNRSVQFNDTARSVQFNDFHEISSSIPGEGPIRCLHESIRLSSKEEAAIRNECYRSKETTRSFPVRTRIASLENTRGGSTARSTIGSSTARSTIESTLSTQRSKGKGSRESSRVSINDNVARVPVDPLHGISVYPPSSVSSSVLRNSLISERTLRQGAISKKGISNSVETSMGETLTSHDKGTHDESQVTSDVSFETADS